jgi:hypothetical protein
MLEKLVVGRLIAVGDPWQSIYAFRGAMSSSMSTLRARFNMREMDLSISFRCPKAIVLRARTRAPHMQWPEWAEEGSVNAPTEWTHIDIPDGAAIICRNNAPLYKTAFKLLGNKRSVSLAGSDIGPRLVRIMQKLGPPETPQADLIRLICEWKVEKLETANKPATINDMAECMKIFAGFGTNLGQALAYAEYLFKQQGTIRLSTGHKSKGGEWDAVYHLDPWLIGPEEQDQNLWYVITTRAKESLYEIAYKDIKW